MKRLKTKTEKDTWRNKNSFTELLNPDCQTKKPVGQN